MGTRLEKTVSSRFFQVWTDLLTTGLGSCGDGVLSVRGKVAHKAANELIIRFLRDTEADSLLFLDSDADIPPNIIHQFREYEPGWDYDILQAWYPRRGWPPRSIWLKENMEGRLMEMFMVEAGHTEDVTIGGTHCCIVRREVFEAIHQARGEGIPLKHFEWFYYPRHQEDSDEIALSREAAELGFRIGATTGIRAGHICELTTDWDSYQDYLMHTGRLHLIQRYRRLATVLSDWLDEDPNFIVAKSIDAGEGVAAAWREASPQTADEQRAFYGQAGNGLLYELLNWNCQPLYERIITPLYEVRGQRCLVIGPGLGTEIEALQNRDNRIDVYELPGAITDFLKWRFDGDIQFWDWPPVGAWDVISAVDVVEHVHPDELRLFLSMIEKNLQAGGLLVLHAEWRDEVAPQHYDHSEIVDPWLAGKFERVGEFAYRKR